MSKPSRTETVTDNLLDHPAVRAWAALKPVRVEPDGIEILKLKNKSAVYRLVGVSEGGSSVVAKRCRTATASVERMMYEEFLPRLPLPALRYHGRVDEAGGEFCWLFLENAGGLEYASRDGEHRALAARWLAAIQTAAVTAGLEGRLPVRDADYYLKLLHV